MLKTSHAATARPAWRRGAALVPPWSQLGPLSISHWSVKLCSPPPPPPFLLAPCLSNYLLATFYLTGLVCMPVFLPPSLSLCMCTSACVQKGRGGGGGGGGRKRTLFYKDCSLGSVKTQLVLAKLLINKNKLKSYFLKLFIWSMNKRENLYMKHENACVCVCVCERERDRGTERQCFCVLLV